MQRIGVVLYDVAIIGAGINGSAMAYELTQKGKRVALFDMQGVASGGSGAAGAFISPKFSKEGELKELIHDAFVYSMQFYENNFPHLLKKSPLLHIAKDEKDSQTLKYYKQHTKLELKTPPAELLKNLQAQALKQESVFLEAGVVHAKLMCEALSKSATFFHQEVKSLVYDDGSWIINETYAAKDVVLATGAYETLLPEAYIELRGVWGHRIDIKTTTHNNFSIHQFVSISPEIDGVTAIGATHNVHYHPQKNQEPYDIEAGREELLQKALKTIELEDIEIIKDYTGLRSGSFDYMPLIGQMVMSKETLECCKKQIRVKKPDFSNFVYYPNLYMINGNGGYGFVLAPYLAKILSEKILSNKEISQRLSPARFFVRWAKKLS